MYSLNLMLLGNGMMNFLVCLLLFNLKFVVTFQDELYDANQVKPCHVDCL